IGLTLRNGCGGKSEKAKCENKEPGVHEVLLAVEFPRTRRLYLQADLDFRGRSGTREIVPRSVLRFRATGNGCCLISRGRVWRGCSSAVSRLEKSQFRN